MDLEKLSAFATLPVSVALIIIVALLASRLIMHG